MGIMNLRRAQWAEIALISFTACTNQDLGSDKEQGDRYEAVKDLITDLLHYANQNGLDVEAIHHSAFMMYESEISHDNIKEI